ncbi:MAG: leukotoxin LktA family filamentous adhesin [Alphaproteobacteria bacterium]
MKYSRSAITQLTRWYRQILIKCAILNAAVMVGAIGMPAMADASEINQDGVPFKTATDIQHNGNIFDISTTTTNGSGDIGLNTFGKFNVSQGDVANLNLINKQDKLVNLVFDSSASQINGIVNSYKGGKIGGNVLFANPNGFVIGQTGVFNVGSLTLMTPTEDTMKKVFDDNAVNGDILDSLVSFKFEGDDYVLYNADSDSEIALYPGSIKVNGTINSGAGIDLITGGNEIEIGATGSLNANMNFSGTGANVTATPKTSVTPNTKTKNTYKFAFDGGNGVVIASSNSGEDRDYLSAIVNLKGKVKANGGDVHAQTEMYQTDATEDKAVSKIVVSTGADVEGHDVTMRAYAHIDGADKNVLGMSGKSSDWQNILNGSDILNFLIEDFVHLGDIKTQVIVEDGAKVKATNDLTFKAEAILPISASSIFETFAFNYTDLDILTEAVIKSGADIKAGNDLKVQSLTDFEMTNNTVATSLVEIVADTFKPFGNYGAYALNISLIDMINRAVIENGVHLDVKNDVSVLASMLRNYTGTTKNGLIPVVDRNRGSAGIGISIMDFTAKNEAIMNADVTIDGSLVVNADYQGSIINTVSASSAAAGEDGNFGLVGRIAQGVLGHGKLTKVFDFLETSKKSRAEATFNKIQIAGAINVAIDEAVNNAFIGDAEKGIKPTITAKNVTVGATLLDNKSQVYASSEADNGETATSGAVVVNLRNLDSNADVYGNLTLTGSDAENALIIRSKTDIQHIEGLWDWLKQTAIGFGWWTPTEEDPDLTSVNSSNVDDYLAQYGMSDDYQKKIDDAGNKFALFNMINFNDIGLNGLFGTFASSQANAASQGKATNAWAGAVSVAVTNATSNALLHDGSTVNILNATSADIKQNIIVQASSVSEVWSGAVLMSLFNAKAAFAGMSARDGDSAGGSLSIAVSDIDTTAKIGENVKITGQNSDVTVKAEEDGEFINIGNGSASADNAGLGGEFVISDVAGGTTIASVEKGAEIKQAKDVKVNADRDDVYVNAAVAYTNSQNSKSFGISPLIVSNAVKAYIAGDITAAGKVEVDAVYDKIIVNTAANLGVAKAGTDNPVFTDLEPEDDGDDVANLDMLFDNLSVIKSPVDPTKYVKTDFTRPLNANKETSAYAGNIVTNIFDSDITAYVADEAKIVADSLKVNATSGDMIIDVGAVVAANGKSGGGATILFDMSKNQIDSYIGKAVVDVTNDLTVSAKEDYMMIDVQAGVAQGKDKSGVGNLSVNLQLNEINAGIKDGAKINTNVDSANQSVNVSANLENKTIKVVGGLSIQAGGSAGGGAKGASVDANVYVNDVNAYIGKADVNAGKSLDVTAGSTAKMIGVDVAGAGSTSDSAYAGTLGTYISNNNIDAHIDGAKINQTAGRANKSAVTKVKGLSEYSEVSVVGTVAGGKSTAVGGSVSARVIADTIDTYVKDTVLDTTNSLTLENKAQIKSVAVSVAGSGSASASAVDGAVMAVIDATTQNNYIEGSTIKADALTMDSDNIYKAIGVTGALAISGGSTAIGGSIYVAVTDNDMNTYIKNSDITTQHDINMTSDINTDSLSIIFAGGGGKGVAGSGAVSTVVNSPDANTYITSDNTDKKVVSDAGKINIKSTNKTDIDTINAAVSVGLGGAAIGASINTVVDSSDVAAGINNMEIRAKGDVDVEAKSEEKIMSISAGGAGGSGVTAAGSVNTMVIAADTDAYIRNSIIAAHSIKAIASGITEITGGTGALSIGAGSVALGASIVTGVIDNEVTAVIENSKADAEEDVIVSAEADETIGKSNAPFITFAGGFSMGVTVEGVVDTMIMSSTADAHIKGKKTIDNVDYGVTAGKDVTVKASGKDTIFAVGGAVSGGATGGVGATINTVVVDKDVKAYAENTKITAAHDIKAEAKEADDFFTTVVAASGAGTAGVSGVVNTNVITSTVASGFKNSELKAENKISSEAEAKADMQTITGAVAGGGAAGIGLSAVNDIIKYNVESYLTGNAEFKELEVMAAADSNYQFTTVSGGGGGAAGIVGVENVNYVNNTVKAYADGILTGKANTNADKIHIAASDEVTFKYPIAGQVSVGGTAGVGGTVMVNAVTSTVESYLGGSGVKAKDIDVGATGKQTYDKVIAMGFSGAGVAAFSGTVLVNDIDTTVQSYIKSNSNVTAEDIDVVADNKVTLTMYSGAGAIGGVGGLGAAVTVNDFKATTEAYTGNGVTINAKNVNISAESETNIGDGDRNKMVVASGSGGLAAGMAGSVLWNTIENKTAAYIGNNNVITLADEGKLDLQAKDTTKVYESVGSASLSGGLALGASVGGNEIHNTVLAYIGTGTQVDGTGADVSVSAQSEEIVDAFALVASGGYIGLSGGAVYTDIGKKVENAAYNNLSSEEKKTFSSAKAQSDEMISKANGKSSGAKDNYQAQYGDAISKVGEKAEKTRISEMQADEDLYAKTAHSSITSTDRNGTTSAFIDTGSALNVKGLTINAENTNNVELETDGGAIGMGAIGVSVAIAKDQTTTNAFVSNNVGVNADSVDILAESTDMHKVNALAAAGGIIAGSGSYAGVDSNRTTNAYILQNAIIKAKSDLEIRTRSDSNIGAKAQAYQGGAGVVGLSIANASTTGSTKIDIGDNVALISAAGDIIISTNTYDKADAEGTATSGGIGAGSGVDVTTKTGKDNTINIGKNLSVDAKGALNIQSYAQNYSETEANGRAYGGIAAGGAVGRAKVDQKSGINIADADAEKKIKAGSMTVKSIIDNEVKSDVYAGAGSIAGISGSESSTSINSVNNNYIGKNYAVETTNGGYTLSADVMNGYKGYVKSDSYGVVTGAIPYLNNYVNSTVSSDSEADIISKSAIAVAASNEIRKASVSGYDLYGGAGGLASGAGGSIVDTLIMNTTAKLGGNKARAQGDFGKGRINVSAYNIVGVNEKANLYSHGGIAGADTDSIVKLTANATTRIANKDISNRDDHISYTARNDVDIYTKVNVESYGGVAGAGGRSEATSSSQKAEVIFDAGAKSVSGRDTYISALSNKSLEAYINAETGGLISIVGGRADAHNYASQAYVTINSGAEIKSFDVMNVEALSSTQKLRAKRDALAYELGFIPYHGSGEEYTDNNNSSGIILNGAIESGLGANRTLVINKDGTTVSENDNIKVSKEKVGEITPADIDVDIDIYEQSKTNATKEYNDFKETQDNLIEGYKTARNNAITEKTAREKENKNYSDGIEILNFLNDMATTETFDELAARYADSEVIEIINLIEATKSGDEQQITLAVLALVEKQPSESIEALQEHIQTNNNSIATCDAAIETNNAHIQEAEDKIAYVTTQHERQIAELDAYINELNAQKAAAAGKNIPVYAMQVDTVEVRSGETNLVGIVSGSGSITAPGNKFSITVDNNSVSDVVYNDLIIGRNLKGSIYGSHIAPSITQNIRYQGSSYKITITNHVDANDPTINVSNGYGDIVIIGNIENVNGALDITNYTGNIISEGSLTVKDLHIKAPNGGYSQVYVNQEMKTGGMSGTGAIVASGDIDIAAKTINVNGLIQSGSEIKTVTIPDFKVVKEGDKYYQIVNGVKTFMKPSEITEGYYYLTLTGDTSDLASIQQIKAYFKPSDDNTTENVPGEIFLFKAGISGGNVTLTGNIVNDKNTGKIVMLTGYGHIDITNNSGYNLVTSALNADNEIRGTLTINDFKLSAGNDTTFDNIKQADLTEEYLAIHAGKYTAKVDENGNIVSTADNITDGNGAWGSSTSYTRDDGAVVYSTTYTPGNDAYMMTQAGQVKSYTVYIPRSWWTEFWYGKKYEVRYYYEQPVYETKNNPIGVNFQGFSSPVINIVSNGTADVIMNNAISAMGGNVNITSGGSILTRNSKYVISADNITLTAADSIGAAVADNVFNPIQTAVYGNGKLTATAGSDIYINFPYTDISNIDLKAGNSNGDGFIYLATATGKFDGTGKEVSIKADALDLRADTIELNAAYDDINIDINKLKARAKDDITITNKDTLVLSSIVSENKGTITITSQEGSILSALDTGTYSDYHVKGGNIVLSALKGSIGEIGGAIKFADSGIFNVEAKGNIYLDSAATMYIDKIQSNEGTLDIKSTFGIIASAISDETRNYHLSAIKGAIAVYSAAGNIENIAIDSAKTVYAVAGYESEALGGLSDINIRMVSDDNMNIGEIKATRNVTLTSNKGIKNGSADAVVSGENITLKATENIGEQNSAINLQANRAVTALTGGGKDVYLSTTEAEKGVKINRIDTNNGEGALRNVEIVSAGNIINNSEQSEDITVINIKAEDIKLTAAGKNIGSSDRFLIVETTSEDEDKGLSYTADTAYILGGGDLFNITGGTSTGNVYVYAANNVSAKDIVANNDEHDASFTVECVGDVKVKNIKSDNLLLTGNNVEITGSAIGGQTNVTADNNSDIFIDDTVIGGDTNLQSTGKTVIGTITVIGSADIKAPNSITIANADIGRDLNISSEKANIGELNLAGNINAFVDDIYVNTSNNLNIGRIEGADEGYVENVEIVSAKNINNGVPANYRNIAAKNMVLIAGESIGENKALNVDLAEDNQVNVKAGKAVNLNYVGASANIEQVSGDEVVLHSDQDVNISDLKANVLKLDTTSENVNITGEVTTKGVITTASKKIIIDNTSLAPYPYAGVQLYLTEKQMHLTVDKSNNVRTEAVNVTRHGMNLMVNKEAYATSMDGELALASETGIRSSYHGEGVINGMDTSLSQALTVSDYIATLIDTPDDYIIGNHKKTSDDGDVMSIINQNKADQLKEEKYTKDEKQKEKLLYII